KEEDMANANANLNEEIRELKEQVQSLSDIVQKKAKKKVKETVREAVDGLDADNILHFDPRDLARMARRAGRDVREFLTEKRDQAEEAYESVEKQITGHPFQSVGVALVSGLLLGLMARK